MSIPINHVNQSRKNRVLPQLGVAKVVLSGQAAPTRQVGERAAVHASRAGGSRGLFPWGWLAIMFLSRGKTSLGPTNRQKCLAKHRAMAKLGFLPFYQILGHLQTCTSCGGFDWLLERLGSSTAIYGPPSGRCRSALPSTTP